MTDNFIRMKSMLLVHISEKHKGLDFNWLSTFAKGSFYAELTYSFLMINTSILFIPKVVEYLSTQMCQQKADDFQTK